MVSSNEIIEIDTLQWERVDRQADAPLPQGIAFGRSVDAVFLDVNAVLREASTAVGRIANPSYLKAKRDRPTITDLSRWREQTVLPDIDSMRRGTAERCAREVNRDECFV